MRHLFGLVTFLSFDELFLLYIHKLRQAPFIVKTTSRRSWLLLEIVQQSVISKSAYYYVPSSSTTYQCKTNLDTLLYLEHFRPFVYQFNSRTEALVCWSFANDLFRRISTSFHHHFIIWLLWLLHEKECSFYTYLFCCTEMRWLFISSSAIWVTGSDTGSVASRASAL